MTGSLSTARLGDIDVTYADSGNGPALVLVHGLAEDHKSWSAQLGLPGFRTYAYDLRGHGGTSLGTADGSLAQLAGDLANFLRAVSGPAICAGFSLGGTVVLATAAQQPQLVRGAVVLGTSTVVGRAAAEFYAERISRVGNARRLAEALRDDTAAAITEPDADIEAITARRVTAIGEGRGYANAARAMAALARDPLTPHLSGIQCPVDVIGAERDTFCPRKAAEIMLAALPDAGYREIPAAGHLMNVDNPAAVTANLLEAAERMK
jgi:3-oxoadipate enol-lactonase